MGIGVVGLGKDGLKILGQLTGKTAENLYCYDPDGRDSGGAARECGTAAELLEHCGPVFIALESASDLTAFCNGIASFLKERHLFIDLTETSPALAHTIANGMRRHGARYLDCGVFGREGLQKPFILFVGGSSGAFSDALPLLRCISADCSYTGPAGRGQAARLFCRALAYRLEHVVEETAVLAGRFGMDGVGFLETLARFDEIADPLARLGGGKPAFSLKELSRDAALVEEMERRARRPGRRG